MDTDVSTTPQVGPEATPPGLEWKALITEAQSLEREWNQCIRFYQIAIAAKEDIVRRTQECLHVLDQPEQLLVALRDEMAQTQAALDQMQEEYQRVKTRHETDVPAMRQQIADVQREMAENRRQLQQEFRQLKTELQQSHQADMEQFKHEAAQEQQQLTQQRDILKQEITSAEQNLAQVKQAITALAAASR